MDAFKVADLRVRFVAPDVTLYVDGIGMGSGIVQASPARAGAMLSVFNARDCYWDTETNSLHTDPLLGSNVVDPAPQQTEGTVSSWEVMIPASGKARVFLGLLPPSTVSTSGDQAVSRKTVLAADDGSLVAILELLECPYVWFGDDGSLRNSDVDVVP